MSRLRRRVTATASLQMWLAALTEATLNPDVSIGLMEGLALSHRPALNQLLNDPEVQTNIDRVCQRSEPQISLEDKLDTIKAMLVDACSMTHLLSKKQSGPSSGIRDTRTEQGRSLIRAAVKAKRLAEDLEGLVGLTGGNLTVSYLQDRFAAGSQQWFIRKRKGWFSKNQPSNRSLSDLLHTLTDELIEEAALIKSSIDRTEQPGRRRHRLTPLIDSLIRHSLKLGSNNNQGHPCPDFHLVHAILTSTVPAEAPDESALRHRWRRQGQRKRKSP